MVRWEIPPQEANLQELTEETFAAAFSQGRSLEMDEALAHLERALETSRIVNRRSEPI